MPFTTEFAAVDLNKVIGETLSLLEHQLGKSHIEVQLSLDDKLPRIKGNPGKGKTMLLIGIVKEMQSTCNSALLSYFFCQATNKSLNNPTAVLRGLIYQLLVQ